MDECDLANVSNDFHLELLTKNRPRPGISQSGKSSEYCIECGTSIPLERQLAMPGCMLCITCQSELEAERD